MYTPRAVANIPVRSPFCPSRSRQEPRRRLATFESTVRKLMQKSSNFGRVWQAYPISGSAPCYATAGGGTVGGPSPSRAHLGGRIERDVERWGFRGPPLEMSVLISGARAQREDVQITRPRPSLAGHPHRQQRSAHPHHSIAEAQRLSEGCRFINCRVVRRICHEDPMIRLIFSASASSKGQ